MLRRPTRIVILVGLMLPGCGATDTALSKRPTRAQYIRESDEICRTARSEARLVSAALGRLTGSLRQEQEGKPPTAEAQVLIRQLAAIFGAENEKRRASPAPSGETATIERLLKSSSEAVVDYASLLKAVDKREVRGSDSAFQALRRAAWQSHELQRSYGFKVCGTAEEPNGHERVASGHQPGV
jgi:hypothetical protein